MKVVGQQKVMRMNNWNNTVQKGQVGYMTYSQDLIAEGELEALRTLYKEELKTCKDTKEKKELTAMHLDGVAVAAGKGAAKTVLRRYFDG